MNKLVILEKCREMIFAEFGQLNNALIHLLYETVRRDKKGVPMNLTDEVFNRGIVPNTARKTLYFLADRGYLEQVAVSGRSHFYKPTQKLYDFVERLEYV